MEERSAWERMRMLATICVQPYSKKKLKGTDLMRFPWDEEKVCKDFRQERQLSKAEALSRFEALVRKNKE